MMKQRLLAAGLVLATGAMAGLSSTTVLASDHDDGETDLKSRALNLTDHYAFRSGTDLSLIMYVNPRSLPGRQYTLSTNARYELHVSKAASRTAAPTGSEDFVFRFEAGPPDAAGVQPITLTVLQDGAVVGTHSGTSTSFAASKAGTIVDNTGAAGPFNVRYFVGMRADSFYFDVVRFFQVRAFLAARFFGGAGGNGDATASLAPNCRGDALLALGGEQDPDDDVVNLWNPPSCAPDFTKDLNVTAIALNVPIAALGGGSVFDTWSTISIAE
jgi:hypothetical protein